MQRISNKEAIIKTAEIVLIEFKLGAKEIEEGANHLCDIEKLIIKFNAENEKNQMQFPSLKMVVTGGQYGYKRDDGVFVVPIGCLKN